MAIQPETALSNVHMKERLVVIYAKFGEAILVIASSPSAVAAPLTPGMAVSSTWLLKCSFKI